MKHTYAFRGCRICLAPTPTRALDRKTRMPDFLGCPSEASKRDRLERGLHQQLDSRSAIEDVSPRRTLVRRLRLNVHCTGFGDAGNPAYGFVTWEALIEHAYHRCFWTLRQGSCWEAPVHQAKKSLFVRAANIGVYSFDLRRPFDAMF